MAGEINRKISEIVSDNYVSGAVLYYFGIEFYHYNDQTLEEVCHQRGLSPQLVIRQLESVEKVSTEEKLELQKFPAELLVEYLKHSHYLFVKQKLPYIVRLIENIDSKGDMSPILNDLKFVFPLFVEEFIHHIYEEEDTLFSYVLELSAYLRGEGNAGRLYYRMENYSLHHFSMEHAEHDDDMKGIRRITSEYELSENAPLQVRVLFSEFQALEQELKIHARVENDILFPKALMIEQKVRQMMSDKILLN
jgi:regulator of cell morphogenesis and NO signaling